MNIQGPMDDKKRIRFFISHLLFIISLASIYFIPYVEKAAGDVFLPPQTRPVRFFIIGVLTLVFFFYCYFIKSFKESGVSLAEKSGLSVYVWISTAAVLLLLCASRAVLSTDLYEYSMRARMFAVYGLNPYLHVPREIGGDMFYPLIFWKNTPECYGPMWVLVGAVHSLPFSDSIAITSFLHKLVLFFFYGASGYFFYRLSRRIFPSVSEVMTAAFLLNPLVVVMTLVDGHNEIVMVAFFLASLYYLYVEKYALSIVLFTAAVLVKFVYLIAAPLVFLYILFGPGKKKFAERAGGIVFGTLLSVFLAVLAWLPFGMKGVSAVVGYYKDLGQKFWADSIPYGVHFLLNKASLPVSQHFVAGMFSLLFLLVYVCVVARFLRKMRTDGGVLFTSIGTIILALLFTNYGPFQAWYFLWALPFIFLGEFRAKPALVVILSYFLILTFWKRMSVLAVPAIFIYFTAVIFGRRCKECIFP